MLSQISHGTSLHAVVYLQFTLLRACTCICSGRPASPHWTRSHQLSSVTYRPLPPNVDSSFLLFFFKSLPQVLPKGRREDEAVEQEENWNGIEAQDAIHWSAEFLWADHSATHNCTQSAENTKYSSLSTSQYGGRIRAGDG